MDNWISLKKTSWEPPPESRDDLFIYGGGKPGKEFCDCIPYYHTILGYFQFFFLTEPIELGLNHINRCADDDSIGSCGQWNGGVVAGVVRYQEGIVVTTIADGQIKKKSKECMTMKHDS